MGYRSYFPMALTNHQSNFLKKEFNLIWGTQRVRVHSEHGGEQGSRQTGMELEQLRAYV